MFERRIRTLALFLLALAVAIVYRLYDLQIVRAAEFEQLVRRLTTRPVRYLPAARGRILDRAGRTLINDEPAWNICIHYAVLSGNSRNYLVAIARDLRRRGDYPPGTSVDEIVSDLRIAIDDMWQRLSQLTGMSVAELIEIGQAYEARVARLREELERRTGVPQPVREEFAMHPVVEGVDHDIALLIRQNLERYPWLRVVPGSRRRAYDVDAMAHLIGRTGPATRERIEADPLREDERRGLRPGDRCGTSGIERMADSVLRGVRGQLADETNPADPDNQEPIRGRDVVLTIDSDLQQRTLEILEQAVAASIHPAGASAVVIDVETREVLVLASYPTYSFESFAHDYTALQADTIRAPLLFRAVAAQYPPGSICKAITLIGGLSERVIHENTTFNCTGHLLPNQPGKFRCWIFNQTPGATHGPESASDAVRDSCNIYFFHVGERLGAERLTEWFSRAGLGRLQGTGLDEESEAILPTADWLWSRFQRRHQPADAWNYAIGQGEVTCTPLQAANVAATIAAGVWRPVVLARDETGRRIGGADETHVPFDEFALRTLRQGMWRVVNESGGTASAARLNTSDYDLCGKTGSAQTVPRVTSRRYTLQWPDGRRESTVASTAAEALARYSGEKPRIVGSRAEGRFPNIGPDEKLPSHAWFIGYTQSKSTRRGATPGGRVYAISVIIEFGGSGGKVAGPVAKQIVELILSREAL